jgi:hypothetical protein
MGWFYGFKLHLVINDQGELLGVNITAGNIDDRDTGPELGHAPYLGNSLLTGVPSRSHSLSNFGSNACSSLPRCART